MLRIATLRIRKQNDDDLKSKQDTLSLIGHLSTRDFLLKDDREAVEADCKREIMSQGTKYRR